MRAESSSCFEPHGGDPAIARRQKGDPRDRRPWTRAWAVLRAFVLALAWVVPTVGHPAEPEDLGARIAQAARKQLGITVAYDPAYVKLPYPGGDVPLRTGVCSDVVIRALRTVGIDLQREVHEDMRKHFREYPQNWGLAGPDRNIDHRRVPNLMRYFERHHRSLNVSRPSPDAFRPGDIVVWDLGGGIRHVGIVSEKKAGKTPLILHNIGRGAEEEDLLFRHRILGHYRVR